MKYYTIREAKTNLSEIIRKACDGEEVIIARGHEPVLKLVPVGAAARERIPGGFEGKISWTAVALEPLADDEMQDLGFE